MSKNSGENKIEIYGVGLGSKGWLEEQAKKKEISLSEYCKHVLLDHRRSIEERTSR